MADKSSEALITVARMYYVQAETMDAIAHHLGVSRSTVSRLLKEARERGLVRAYHDRSDGGLFVAAAEMAFASRCGVTLDLDGICFDAQALDVDGAEKRPNLMAGRDFENVVRALFNEEVGALIQVRREDRSKLTAALREAGLPYHFVGMLNEWDEIRIIRNEQTGKHFFGYGDKAGAVTSKYPAEALDHPVISEVLSEESGEQFLLLHNAGDNPQFTTVAVL